MKRVLLGITVVIGLFAIAESLKCNTCSLSTLGFCVNPSSANCTTNTSVCTTSIASFTGITGLLTINSQSCIESALCGFSSNNTILGATYTINQTCCNTDSCNPVTLGGASYVQLSLTAVLSAALLSCVWGQSVY